jgi:putative ABC transport system permease protein
MKFDIDRFKEIMDTLTRNKSRSFLTGFGIFWGVFMLLALTGGGQGLKDLLSANFKGFATNSGIIASNQTTMPYKGFKSGRTWNMVVGDIDIVKHQVVGADIVTPVSSFWGRNAVYGNNKMSCNVKGVLPEYSKVETPSLKYGRYLNDMDVAQNSKVCVLGKKVYQKLFPAGGDPCGKFIKLDAMYLKVIGVDYSESNMNVNGSSSEAVIIPNKLMRQAYNKGETIELLCITAKSGYRVADLLEQVRLVEYRQHYVNPKDKSACFTLNAENMFMIVDSLFKGLNILILLVGLGTLFAGAIGVSNIMMVTVKERTTEIGIRRAIGATPKMILSQIISESIVLTMVAGALSIVFTVLILSGAELAATTDGVLKAHFQIGFWTAISAVLILTALGVLAGLAPALRAMSIKPVDAMRDE